MVDAVVIGAGIAGASAARVLHDAGLGVVVVEKARGPGGRMATRHSLEGDFDHGAQYFTARDPRFRGWLEGAVARGAAARWPAADGAEMDGQAWVGTPGMNALAADLLAGIGLRTGVRVARMERGSGQWRLFDPDGGVIAAAPLLVVSAPAPQAVDLLQGHGALSARLGQAAYAPCWALLVAVRGAARPQAALGRLAGGDIAWWALDSDKPGRTGEAATLVVHASEAYSRRQLEASPESVVADLLPQLPGLTGLPQDAVLGASAHRWRFARVTRALGEPALLDAETGVAVVGDACLGPRVESAWLSGYLGAQRLLDARRAPGPV